MENFIKKINEFKCVDSVYIESENEILIESTIRDDFKGLREFLENSKDNGIVVTNSFSIF